MVSVYSIVQANIPPHVGCVMDALLAFAHAFQRVGGQVVILHLVEPAFDDLAQVVRLAAPCPGRDEWS